MRTLIDKQLKTDDKDILLWIGNGQEDKAMKYLYDGLFPKVRTYILRNKGTVDDAYDIFQEALIGFYEKVKKSGFNNEYSIEAYVFVSSRNRWINYVNRKKHQTVHIESDYFEDMAVESSFDQLIAQEHKNQLQDILGKLGERCKELLVNIVYYSMNMRDICKQMGFKTENGAKNQKYRCKQKLISLCEADPGIEKVMRNYQY